MTEVLITTEDCRKVYEEAARRGDLVVMLAIYGPATVVGIKPVWAPADPKVVGPNPFLSTVDQVVEDPTWCKSVDGSGLYRCWLDRGHREFHRNHDNTKRWCEVGVRVG